MAIPDRKKHLAEKVRSDLAVRSLQGAWAQPVAALGAFFTGGVAERAPWVAGGFLAGFLALSAARIWLLRRLRLGLKNPRAWDLAHAALLLLCALAWGLIPAYAICAFGRYDQATLIVSLFHAGISVGVVTVLVHEAGQIQLALVFLFVPEIAAQFIVGGPGFWKPLPAYALYMGYLAITGRKLHLAYSQQISDNHDLAMLALQDNLTGLPNRRSMGEALRRAIAEAQEHGSRVAMFYVDFDGFKQINDTYSHRVGDLFLCEVAKRLSSCLGQRGMVARLGGDEFTAVMNGVDARSAAEIAGDLLRATREPLVIEGAELKCTVSIGVGLFPDDAHDADHLVRVADQAMYIAKTSGKNKFCFPVPRELGILSSLQ